VNEATLMAYDRPDGGISPHRDRARYRGAVIVFTVEGTAPFRIHHSRDIEDVVASRLTTPGRYGRAPGGGRAGCRGPGHALCRTSASWSPRVAVVS
jgi:hypothetical protein